MKLDQTEDIEQVSDREFSMKEMKNFFDEKGISQATVAKGANLGKYTINKVLCGRMDCGYMVYSKLRLYISQIERHEELLIKLGFVKQKKL
jgi:predicted transcriptional regulator